MKEQIEMEPYGASSGEEDDGSDDSGNSSDGFTECGGTSTIGPFFSKMGLSDTQSGGVPLFDTASSDFGTNMSSRSAAVTSNGGVSVGAASAVATSKSNATQSNGPGKPFNPKGYTHDSTSTAASASNPRKFAKIGAVSNQYFPTPCCALY